LPCLIVGCASEKSGPDKTKNNPVTARKFVLAGKKIFIATGFGHPGG
jgi:hypothetical protein